jgi:hypothetical protein
LSTFHPNPYLEDQISVSMTPSDRVTKLYPRLPGPFHHLLLLGRGILTFFPHGTLMIPSVSIIHRSIPVETRYLTVLCANYCIQILLHV